MSVTTYLPEQKYTVEEYTEVPQVPDIVRAVQWTGRNTKKIAWWINYVNNEAKKRPGGRAVGLELDTERKITKGEDIWLIRTNVSHDPRTLLKVGEYLLLRPGGQIGIGTKAYFENKYR